MKASATIASAKEKYLRQIEANNRVIADRKDDNRAIEAKLRLLEEIEGETGSQSATKNDSGSTSQQKRYEAMRLTDAAFDAVHRLYEKQPEGRLGKSAVAKYMTENGFVPKGKNFPISVDIALRRLALAGKIETYLKDKKRGYRPLKILS